MSVAGLYESGAEGPGEVEDAALVRACARGDKEALGALFDRYARDVYRFVARLSGASDGDLDDRVQTTFLEVERASSSYRGQASVRSWILGTAVNVVRHDRRGRARRLRTLEVVRELPPAAADGPDVEAERREAIARLQEALDRLPHHLRVVFVACVLDQMSGPEVAAMLGVPEGTVWRRLHEARKKIAESIQRRSR